MTYVDEIWLAHQSKAEQALDEARVLFDARLYDGAKIRALGSCIQIAKAVAVRLRGDRDPKELVLAIKAMVKDGRLPESLYHPFREIIKAHDQQIETSLVSDAANATQAIELAETFQRALLSSSEITVSRNSPEVKKAAAEKGRKIPTGW